MSTPAQRIQNRRRQRSFVTRHRDEPHWRAHRASQQREYRRRQRVASDLANDEIAHSADRVRRARRESSAYASTITNKYNALPVLAGSRFGKQLYACLWCLLGGSWPLRAKLKTKQRPFFAVIRPLVYFVLFCRCWNVARARTAHCVRREGGIDASADARFGRKAVAQSGAIGPPREIPVL